MLQEVSYYSLINGYKDLFKSKSSEDIYLETANFEEIYYIYLLDLTLSNIILKYLLMIEKSFKTKIAYCVAKKFGVNHNQYLLKKNYSNRTKKRNNVIEKLEDEIDRCYSHTPTYYYKNTKQYVPPWILANDIMFGLAQQWFNILQSDLKREIIAFFFDEKFNSITQENKLKYFADSLHMLKEFRNKVAHGSRTFNYHSPNKIIEYKIYEPIKNVVSPIEYKSNLGKNDFFSILVAITILLNEPLVKNMWIHDLEEFKADYLTEDIMGKNPFEIFKLPYNFVDRLKTI